MQLVDGKRKKDKEMLPQFHNDFNLNKLTSQNMPYNLYSCTFLTSTSYLSIKIGKVHFSKSLYYIKINVQIRVGNFVHYTTIQLKNDIK